MLTGLTDEQVNERIAEGKVNADENPNTRTYKQIIRENTLTFFNFLNLVLLVLVLLVGSYKNAFFVCIIVINTLIGIAQEIRAKKTIDKLAILTARKSVVIREGQKWTVPTEELVLDDVVCLKTGDQVPADARVLEGSVEVNESLLTGESDNLPKNVGDELFSGSFVTSGEANCQIIHVGKDNYAAQITSEAKEFKRHNSELKNSLNAILKVISIIIVPIGALLFYKQYYIVGDTFKDSIVSMVAGVLGMIPEGLVLLTSVALTLGALVLANKKTLVQELYCIETLARVDTLCLDKTGTITEGTMCVERVEPYRVSKDESTDAEVDAGLAEITESAELTEMDTESRQTGIKNGDRVEIITSQNSKGPSRDWLKLVKSTQAKNKINQWFKSELKEDNILRGRALLDKYCKAKDINYSELNKPEYMEKVMKRYAYRDWDSVLASIGHGALKEGQVINKMLDERNKKLKKEVTDTTILDNMASDGNKVPVIAAGKSKSGIVVKGIHDLAVRFSKCCSPVPGDEIVGFVTRGRGISIHRTDCINVMNLPQEERERLIEAEWQQPEAQTGTEKYSTEIKIYANNRIGMFVDISKVFTERQIDITSMNVRTSKQGKATIVMTFDIHGIEELNKLSDKLRQIEGVLDIERTAG